MGIGAPDCGGAGVASSVLAKAPEIAALIRDWSGSVLPEAPSRAFAASRHLLSTIEVGSAVPPPTSRPPPRPQH